MELREWANHILAADTIEGKLLDPEVLTDEQPGSPIIWKEPARPPGMSFTKRTREDKLPPFQQHNDPDKRAICLHRFAGHELLAVEIMAFTLLAFPDAPHRFRKGLAHTLREEQGHVKLYMDRMKALGINFGDLPLYRHFWNSTPSIISPVHYVSLMSLTFEMANLDFAPMYGKSFLHHGDKDSAALMATILKDEISHVRFGWRWLRNLKEKQMTEWDAWNEVIIASDLSHKRARGFVLHEDHRIQAGVSPEWIEKFKEC